MGSVHNPDFTKMKTLMKEPVIFDGRNLFDLNEMTSKSLLFEYRKKNYKYRR